MEKDYEIAGLRVRMDTWGRTEIQAIPYLTNLTGDPDIRIVSDPEALRVNQPHLSLEDCEYLCTGGSFYRQLLKHDGMLLHASAVVMDGYAYLFSAPCGTGKSTHTALWQKEFGNRVRMLNDDKPALRREKGVWYAYGTPWSGKTDRNLNIKAPVGGVCVLARGQENVIQPFAGPKAIFAILEQTARPYGSEARGRLLELVGQLMEEVPVWKLHCTPTAEAAQVAWKAMSQQTKEK